MFSAHTTDMQRQKPMDVSPGLLVLGLGLATSALALFLVYVLNLKDVNMMGFYLNYVIPAGSIGVGLVAGAGYAIGSRLKHYRVTIGFLLGTFLIQIVVYFAAQYVTYHQMVGEHQNEVSFGEYYQWMIENVGWKPDKEGGEIKPFGKWGYAVEALAILGFAGGSLISLAGMKGMPYCEYCTRYMKKRLTVAIPATAEKRSIKKKDVEARQAYDAECQVKAQQAQDALNVLREMMQAGIRADVAKQLQTLQAQYQKNAKVKTHVVLTYHECESCDNYRLAAIAQTVDGNNTSSKPIFTYQKAT